MTNNNKNQKCDVCLKYSPDVTQAHFKPTSPLAIFCDRYNIFRMCPICKETLKMRSKILRKQYVLELENLVQELRKK